MIHTKEQNLHKTEMLLALRNNLLNTMHLMKLCIKLTPNGKDKELMYAAEFHLSDAKDILENLSESK